MQAQGIKMLELLADAECNREQATKSVTTVQVWAQTSCILYLDHLSSSGTGDIFDSAFPYLAAQ